MPEPDGLHAPRVPHPFVYTLLIAPFGAVYGFVQVAIGFLVTRYGMSVEDGAILVATAVFPHVWKFFWSPVADTTLSRKRWYMISVTLCAIGVTTMSVIPLRKENLLLLQAIVFITATSVTFVGMAVEGLMAHATPPEQRGRVGGWFQAGNLGGSGIGGGLGLWMATHLPSPWMSGAILGVLFMACSLMLMFVPEAPADRRSNTVLGVVGDVARDLWNVIKSRQGILCAVLCFLPIATGAATSVLGQAEVALHWNVAEDTVALVGGVLNGVIAAFGCLVGGEICARISPRRVYAMTGVLLAMIAVGMAVTPFVPVSYVVFALLYAFAGGLAYASFTGFVLQAIGKGAAATKYNAFASLANAPITYMGLLLAAAYTRFGARGMLFTEAIVSGLSLMVLLALVAGLKLRSADRSAAHSAPPASGS